MRSPAVPRSAMSCRSVVLMSRPTGMRPGGNVLQVPPPAVEANVPVESTGVETGTAGTGVSTDRAIAISGAYVAVDPGTAARPSVAASGGDVATATAGGIRA